MSGTVRLRPPSNALDHRVVAVWRTTAGIVFGPPVLVLALLGLLIPPARVWLLVPAAVIALVALPYLTALPRWWYGVHRWEVTDDAVYTRAGYFWQEWRVAPMSRIQTVDTLRGPIEQAFGLSTLVVTTASAKGALKIRGLEQEVAADLAERLTAITQATPGDAT
ncbi:PH domain-containing protein [Kribbella sandramycini]|uniref:Membrane protein YdbS with pleckstrin-like domain n=1 Tax=Kribbella sandramycini TaxID=60450 RepID=A0A7Y4P4A2_9ACTN|nr:PH domain-containing protein [Kribbella sandramycini]MBB6565909.1 membrane protein YdbS with pleckstrin-like domain [Kribbella sandramycini]NOL44915.1 PH domain-containing protein [Kribbella sandramycini]